MHQRFLLCLVLLIAVWVFGLPPAAAAPAAETQVESYFWPPGLFLNFSRLKQAQKDHMIAEVEKKLAFLRQTGKGLLVRGDLMEKVRPEVSELNPAAILDQSGMIVLVRNFPNIYFNFSGPPALLNRSTFVVIKNPKVDGPESILRQSLVITGDFYAFTQAYIRTTVEKLQKALQTDAPQSRLEGEAAEKSRKMKKP